jgi:hypothetical protein
MYDTTAQPVFIFLMSFEKDATLADVFLLENVK